MSGNRIFKLISDSKELISVIREQLEILSLKECLRFWQKQNKYIYQKEVDEMIKCNIFPEKFADGKDFPVAKLRYISYPVVIAYIRENNKWSDSEKKRLLNCYTSFIDWLNTISCNWFKTDLPVHQMSPYAMKRMLTFEEFRRFIEILHKNNPRDELIARLLLKKRVSNVLGLRIEDIDFEKNTIRYGNKREVYGAEFIRELKEYIISTAKLRGNNKFVFVTNRGNPVDRSRLNHFFIKMCKLAGIKRISPDSLRATYEMFIHQNYKDAEIMRSGKKSFKNMLNPEISQ